MLLWKGIMRESMEDAFVENKANVPWRAGGVHSTRCETEVRLFEPGQSGQSSVIDGPSPIRRTGAGGRAYKLVE